MNNQKVKEERSRDSELNLEEEKKRLLAQYDKESNTREWQGLPKSIVKYICVAFTAFVVLINSFWFLPPQVHRASFVAFIILLVFLLYPANRKDQNKVNHIPWYDMILGLIGAACFFYFTFNFQYIITPPVGISHTYQLVLAILGVAIVFIACQRVMGWSLVIVVGFFLAYTWFGQFIPGPFGHGGFRAQRVFEHLFFTTEGVLSVPIGVASTFIFVFLLFGAIMNKTGIGQFFIDISNVLVGRTTGGPAKMAVVVSGLSGTISGSSVANVVTTGSFTIPLMKRMGYDENFSGAVEATASTGGQIVPPILGAAAFLMAEITGIPYEQIALAALIPAILYYVSIFTAVHFEAKKKKLRGLPPEEIPRLLPLILQKGQLMLSIVALVVFLMLGFTPTRSAFMAILATIAISMIKKETRLTVKKLLEVMEEAAKSAVGVAIACATAGIIIGVVTLTGLGHVFISSIMNLAAVITHDYLRLLAVLILCMFASLILGMGIPTTAKYIIMATITAPVLYMMGVPLLAAHMFVFYFGVDADITPPVALASYAAAGIAKGDPMKTSITSVRLGIAAYLIPFFFVLNPQMLFIDATPIGIIQLFITSVIGIVGVAVGLCGYFIKPMEKIERILMIGGGLLLIHYNTWTDIAGVSMFVLAVLIQMFIRQSDDEAIALA
ncbi:MAG: TRAP transporter permease [Defluviitaleaceae bacterium]|nr:TRAP transporter permease [Defluviitaleaceae bacterium]